MNIAHESANHEHHPPGTWQTDTGPVAVPDLSAYNPDSPADCIQLGFIAINNLQVRAYPTP
jgi:hypothetical protein